MSNDTLDVIIAVLKFLDESLDEERIDFTKINPQTLGVSEPRYYRVLEMMIEEGYISGFQEVSFAGVTYNQYKAMNPNITLRGLAYIDQNKPTAKAYQILKEIKEWIPGY